MDKVEFSKIETTIPDITVFDKDKLIGERKWLMGKPVTVMSSESHMSLIPRFKTTVQLYNGMSLSTTSEARYMETAEKQNLHQLYGTLSLLLEFYMAHRQWEYNNQINTAVYELPIPELQKVKVESEDKDDSRSV